MSFTTILHAMNAVTIAQMIVPSVTIVSALVSIGFFLASRASRDDVQKIIAQELAPINGRLTALETIVKNRYGL